VHVVGLQKSQRGKSYYLNLGIFIKSSASVALPKPRECPLQCRLGEVPGTPAELDAALNEEDSWRMDVDHRREVIRLALCNADFAFFSQLRTIPEVIEFLKNRRWPALAIGQELANLAGIPR
jgi:Domain of unknown function (DUF4304)